MSKTLIGKKVGMTQIFDEEGKVVPVTVIEVGPCTVTQIKTVEQDGYQAIQLGFKDVKENKLTKPELGKFTKSKLAPKRYLREFRLDSVEGINVGDELKADVFAAGDKVDIQGTSKGKGFQGVIKRHGQWDMDLCIIEDQVQWDQHQHQVEYSQERDFQDTWVLKQLQYKI